MIYCKPFFYIYLRKLICNFKKKSLAGIIGYIKSKVGIEMICCKTAFLYLLKKLSGKLREIFYCAKKQLNF